MNMKGGVGKTTIALHLAGILAVYDISDKAKNILLIDYDPQFNLSQAFLPAPKYFELEKLRKTTLAILQDEETDLDPFRLQVPGNEEPPKVADLVHNVFVTKKGRRLDLIPSTLDLLYLALGQSEHRTTPIEKRFDKFIAQCREKYDVIVIDCHPAGSIFTKTSLRNSDHVIIPLAPQKYGVRGIGLMIQFIKALQLGPAGPELHILFNVVPRIGVTSEEQEIRANPRFTKACFNNTLKRFTAFSVPMGGKGFVWLSHKPYSTVAFANLMAVVREFAKRTNI
jgi:chromosome partitioning protein